MAMLWTNSVILCVALVLQVALCAPVNPIAPALSDLPLNFSVNALSLTVKGTIPSYLTGATLRLP